MDKVLDTDSLQFFHVGRSTGYDKYGTAIQSLEGRNSIFCIFIVTRTQYHDVTKYRGVPIEMISESLGHKSIKTTQIYLKGFELEERTKVNKLNYSYVCNFKTL